VASETLNAMQIRAFILYHRDGERCRVLPLHRGLNVITGWRNTGKSSLLDIVEYCFGRSTLTVSRGKIRRTVGWYGLILRDGDRYVFAGRPAPKQGAATTTDAMWLPLPDDQPPAPGQLAVNTTAAALREQLSAFSRFADVRFDPPADAARPPLRLHVGHVLPACIQDEEDIDSKTRLFHRGHERELMQALRDAMGYWVGASDEHTPALRSRLIEVRRELSQAQRTLDRLLDGARDADERALSLLTQAAAVGLAAAPDLDGTPPTGADVHAALRSAAAQDPDEPPATTPAGEVEALLARRRELHDLLAVAQRDEALLRDFGDDRDAFAAETGEQRARLTSIGLLHHDADAATCPVCASELAKPDPTADALREHLTRLEDELAAVAAIEPRTRQALERAVAETRGVREQLRVINATLRDLADRDRGAAAARGLSSRRAYAQGLIAEYLRTAAASDPAGEQQLRDRIAVLTAEQAELQTRVDADAETQRLAGALNIIGADMTQIARRLSLEHAEAGHFRIDLGRMTIIADTLRDGSFPLAGIGGAGTRVGYHLAAHLALHRLLRQRQRPGPAFLLLDHPTGPFYPEDTPEGEEPQLLKESDRAIVATIFELLRSVADDLDGDLQILVCDHARLDEPWFEAAVVEDWREGRGLIPDGWDDDDRPADDETDDA
jgi:hypothetical protein